MLISIIVAVAENGAIGKDNQLLWRLPDDLKRFKTLTMGHPMIMGRKTFDSIGKPLPGRTSIVVTRNKDFSHPGVVVVHSLEEAILEAQKYDTTEAFVIGGGELYRMAQYVADHLYITEVEVHLDGDTFFTIENPEQWTETQRTRHEMDAQHPLAFSFVDFIKKQD